MKLNTLIPIYAPVKKLCCGGTFADGGEIEGLYKKIQDSKGDMSARIESASQLWDAWTDEQKVHFLQDHVFENWGEDDIMLMEEVFEKPFNSLPDIIIGKFYEHIDNGYYAKGGKIGNIDIDNVLLHYVVAALWSTPNYNSDGGDDMLDAEYSFYDVDEKTLDYMRREIEQFVKANADAISKSGMTDEQLGHDIWLSSNGHGAGFFDRGYDEAVEKQLMDYSRKMKGVELEVGDDNKIHALGVFAKGGEVWLDEMTEAEQKATLKRRYARLTKEEAKRLDELAIKVKLNEQSEKEDEEFYMLVHKYRGWDKKAKGGKTKAREYSDTFEEVEDQSDVQIYIRNFGYVGVEDNDKVGLLCVAKITDLDGYMSEEELSDEGNFQLDITLLPVAKYISKKYKAEANGENNSMSDNTIVNVENYMGGLNYQPQDKVFFKTQEAALDYLMSKELNDTISLNGMMSGFIMDKAYNRIGQTNWERLNYIMGVTDRFAKGGKPNAKDFFNSDRNSGLINQYFVVEFEQYGAAIKKLVYTSSADRAKQQIKAGYGVPLDKIKVLHSGMSEGFLKEGIYSYAKGGKTKKKKKTPKMVRMQFEEQTFSYADGGDTDKYKVVAGTAYHKETPDAVINVLENARQNRTRIKLYYGDVETGRDWMEVYDTVGTIGRSTGTFKIPLLIKTSASMGGGGILDHCIVKIKDVKSGIVLYKNPKYYIGDIAIVESDMKDKGYTHNVEVNGEVESRHKSLKSAQIFKSKIMAKGGIVKKLIGKKVTITSDNENYNDYKGKVLVITHAEIGGRAYDNTVYPDALVDLKVKKTGESVPFSLYEYEFDIL